MVTALVAPTYYELGYQSVMRLKALLDGQETNEDNYQTLIKPRVWTPDSDLSELRELYERIKEDEA